MIIAEIILFGCLALNLNNVEKMGGGEGGVKTTWT